MDQRLIDLFLELSPGFPLEDTEACWTWPDKGTEHKGYVFIGGKVAHRIAYELVIGPIPDGLEANHECRHKPCRNPFHIKPMTHAENVRYGFANWSCPPELLAWRKIHLAKIRATPGRMENVIASANKPQQRKDNAERMRQRMNDPVWIQRAASGKKAKRIAQQLGYSTEGRN